MTPYQNFLHRMPYHCRLSAELLKRIQEPDWRSVQHDLDENQKMEEEFIENLKKPL